MIRIANKVINVPILDMLYELKRQLNLKGIDKLRSITVKGDNVRITCPSHKGGQENHPSCSVLLVDKVVDKEELPAGFVSCFTCKYTATFPKLVADCFEQSVEWAESWLIETFDYQFIEDLFQLKQLPLSYNEFVKDEARKIEYVGEDILQSYRYYHPYMWKRKLTPEIVDKFDIGYNKYNNTITFPVCDNKGCAFIVERYIDYKRFNIPEGVKKIVFGLNKITEDIHTVVVCESVINALTCWVYGKPAVALLGTGTEEQIEELKRSHINHFILGFDGDDAGKRAEIKFRKLLRDTKLVTAFHVPPNKDINDLSKEEFDDLKQY